MYAAGIWSLAGSIEPELPICVFRLMLTQGRLGKAVVSHGGDGSVMGGAR
jgi:hypothetical protein